MNSQQIRRAVTGSLSPGRFFVSAAHRLRLEHTKAEETAWELFRGHLLDESRTRQRRKFKSWHVFLDRSELPATAPVISVRLDETEETIYVTRSLLMHSWVPFEQTPGVIATHSSRRWMPELVGSAPLDVVSDTSTLERLVDRLVFLAVVGTSRLPITSHESPLPAFMLGEIAYLPIDSPSREPIDDPPFAARLALDQLTHWVQAKAFEAAIRASHADSLSQIVDALGERLDSRRLAADEISTLFRTLFNHVSLSPYTDFVDKLVEVLMRLAEADRFGPGRVVDLVGYMLRHLGRHLSAFDLVQFHNRGANYPDALMLDRLLNSYLRLIDEHPGEFANRADAAETIARAVRLRRRAMRQACLLRMQYEGHAVPDAPTSPGENLRVFPPPLTRVPDEQIFRPETRRKRLFVDEPIDSLLGGAHRDVLARSVDDLKHDAELRELGTALFLDRPLGIFKEPAEVDRTPLLSYQAFSREIAERRLRKLELQGMISGAVSTSAILDRLAGINVRGFAASELPPAARPGVVTLEDALQAADDFVYVQTTRQSLREFLASYEFGPLAYAAPRIHAWLHCDEPKLLLRTGGPDSAQPGAPLMTAFDLNLQPRLKLGVAPGRGGAAQYIEVGGTDFLQPGLLVLALCETDGDAGEAARRDLRHKPLLLPPKLFA